MELKTDEYGEIINAETTYGGIAEELYKNSVIIGWSDGNGTHLDILFTLKPLQFGSLQGGVKGRTDLFVSIMRWGAFGFEATITDTHAGYFDEKLGGTRTMGAQCSEAIAELINGVRKHLDL